MDDLEDRIARLDKRNEEQHSRLWRKLDDHDSKLNEILGELRDAKGFFRGAKTAVASLWIVIVAAATVVWHWLKDSV